MEFLILFLLFIIGGSSGGLMSSKYCERQLSEEFQEIVRGFPPNELELKTICPELLALMECYEKESLNKTGQTVQELANSSSVGEAQGAKGFINFFDLFKDVCNEETQFHQNYVEVSQCLKDMDFMEVMGNCGMEGYRQFDIFITSSFADRTIEPQFNCICRVFELTCHMKKAKENCQETAEDLILEIERRLNTLGVSQCYEDSLNTLMGKFLDFLESQGYPRDYYSSTFATLIKNVKMM